MADDTEFYVEVGRRIKRARKERGLTQAALASLVSLTRTSVTNIEKGRQKMLIHTLADLAACLHAAPAELIPEKRLGSERNLDDLLKHEPKSARDWIKVTLASSGKRR